MRASASRTCGRQPAAFVCGTGFAVHPFSPIRTLPASNGSTDPGSLARWRTADATPHGSRESRDPPAGQTVDHDKSMDPGCPGREERDTG
ncbi:hypothetical protein Purlil1_1306 [Purpureocillium lilacinum]|uniref:Uncharacterized protein n=1 Tax=Purpureocillium lilacinum TaxID=33203 RepID=A0ABR0CFA3_PURLI|nr:hypothetical protein Purlil1_1306 [Purpureocillium lilacinum]